MGSFVYIFFGSCKDIVIGPTAIMAIMTQPSVVEGDNPDIAVLLTFLTGCIIVVVSFLRLGKSRNLRNDRQVKRFTSHSRYNT